MVNLYVYITLLSVISLLLVNGLNTSLRYVPKKIKVMSVIVMLLLFLRVFSLFTLFFSSNINYLYLLKPLVLVNIPVIPLVLLMCMYIFLRNDKINFSYIFPLAAFFLVAYLLLMYRLPAVVRMSQIYGYTIQLLHGVPVLYGFAAFNTLILIVCILQTGKQGANTVGIYFVTFTAIVCIAEVLLNILGLEAIPHGIVGDFLSVLTMNFALQRLKN